MHGSIQDNALQSPGLKARDTRAAVTDDVKAVLRRVRLSPMIRVKDETRDVIACAEQAVAADRDTQSLARRERVISLCARDALDTWSRGR
jgi:hypothetical protein